MSRKIAIVYDGDRSEDLDHQIKVFLTMLNFEFADYHRKTGTIETTHFKGEFKGKSEKEWR